MIQEVSKGEKVQAETINQLIVAANGPQRPQGWFVNTPNGSLHNPQSNMGYQPSPPVPEMNFQAKYVAQWEMTSRSGEYDEVDTENPQKMGWDILVGPDCATITGYYAVDGIVVLGSEDTMDVKLEDIIDRRDPQGFVRTGIYEKPSIKLAIWRSKSEDGGSRKDVLVIQSSDLSEASDRIKNLYPADNDYKLLVSTLLASHDDRNITYQYNREMSLYKKDGDADLLSSTQKSIETGSLSGETCFQLYNFPTETDLKKYDDLDDKLSAYDILLRNTNISSDTSAYTLCYANLSAITMTDSELENATSSIQHNIRYGKGELELYKFHDDTYKKDNVLSSDQILLRTVEQGEAFAKLQYAPLSSVVSALEDVISGMTAISGDHDVIPGYSNSIDTQKDSRGTYHQLYGFENPTTKNFYQLKDGKYQFVIRDYNSQDKYIVYSDISSFVNNLVISGDSNIPATRSISLVSQAANKFYQLYNWQGYNHTPMVAEIEADGQVHYINEVNGAPGPKHLLFEDHMTGELEYHALGIKIPPPELSSIGGGDEIIQNITVLSADLSALSADLSALDNFWVKGEDSQENYGSSIGDSSKNTVINLDTKRLNGTWYTDNGDMNVGGTCFANKLETSTVLQIGGTTLNETQLQQLLRLI